MMARKLSSETSPYQDSFVPTKSISEMVTLCQGSSEVQKSSLRNRKESANYKKWDERVGGKRLTIIDENKCVQKVGWMYKRPINIDVCGTVLSFPLISKECVFPFSPTTASYASCFVACLYKRLVMVHAEE